MVNGDRARSKRTKKEYDKVVDILKKNRHSSGGKQAWYE